MYRLKLLVKYFRFFIKAIFFKIANEGEIRFSGFVDIGPMVTIRVPKGGTLFIGRNTAILQNTFIYSHGDMTIGEKVLINRNCYISCVEKIVIDDYVMIAESVSIHDNDHVLSVDADVPRIEMGFSTSPIFIEKNAWLCSKCTILKGVRISACAIVAASAVVDRNVPSNWIYAGIPARALREIR